MSHLGSTCEGPAARSLLVGHLVCDLALGQIHSVAFVVESDASWTPPLYDVAIATARRGWKIGIPEVRYWFVTPEPQPLASFGPAVSVAASQRLEPEGITFIGSTYPDVRHSLVRLDPQGESIEADLVVSLGHNGGFQVTSRVPVGLGQPVPVTLQQRMAKPASAYRPGATHAVAVATVHPLPEAATTRVAT